MAASALLATSTMAEPATQAAPNSSSQATQITLELNKLEAQDKSCRAYLVVGNDGQTAYQSFKLDLVMFQPDGIIGKRFALDLAPIRAGKKTVKLFLVNDIMECKADNATADDCLSRLALSSLGQVKISK
jgi:hypothetical protein